MTQFEESQTFLKKGLPFPKWVNWIWVVSTLTTGSMWPTLTGLYWPWGTLRPTAFGYSAVSANEST